MKKIIKDKKTYYILGTLLLLVLLLNSFKNNFSFSNPFLSFFAQTVKVSDQIKTTVSTKLFPKNEDSKDMMIEKLRSENEELKKNLSKNAVTQADLEELRELKSTLNYVSNHSVDQYISTSIIYKNDGNYFTSFVIDAGERSGVKKDSIVIGQNGLLGVIFEVNKNYSKGISILDSNMSMSFEVLRNKEITGVASQNIAINTQDDFNGYLKGYLFDKNQHLYPGDILVTSGLGLYPGGIQIGEVEEVIQDKANILKYVKIKPYINFKTINKILVINPRDMQ